MLCILSAAGTVAVVQLADVHIHSRTSIALAAAQFVEAALE